MINPSEISGTWMYYKCWCNVAGSTCHPPPSRLAEQLVTHGPCQGTVCCRKWCIISFLRGGMPVRGVQTMTNALLEFLNERGRIDHNRPGWWWWRLMCSYYKVFRIQFLCDACVTVWKPPPTAMPFRAPKKSVKRKATHQTSARFSDKQLPSPRRKKVYLMIWSNTPN